MDAPHTKTASRISESDCLSRHLLPNGDGSMEGDNTEVTLEKNRLAINVCRAFAPVSGKFADCGKAQVSVMMAKEASHEAALSPVTSTRSSAQNIHTSSDIKATLENESVWSRFHSLGTEMILTKQGRRMFPCCRFRLSGLDPARKYSLVMDITPLDDFTHKWNGKMWEPVSVGEPHVPGQVCVHPESPTLGQVWMDSPVSFYKVKLSSDSTDQEGCLLLHPMRRYQPRLYVVPVDSDSEETIALNGPNVTVFTFSKTEFYAVTSYQNPQITQLKIDCNPFAMAFREDSQSVRLVQNKLRLCSAASTRFPSPVLSLARSLGEKRKVSALKQAASLHIKEDSKKDLSSCAKKEDGILTKPGTQADQVSSCPDGALCKDTDSSENDKANEVADNSHHAEPTLSEHTSPMDSEASDTVSVKEPVPNTKEHVSPISSLESSKHTSEGAVNYQISCTLSQSPTAMSSQIPQSQENIKQNSTDVSVPKPPFRGDSPETKHSTTHPYKRNCPGAKKAKTKWRSKVKSATPGSVATPSEGSVQPDLEDVEGMLFVSFVAKETMNPEVENKWQMEEMEQMELEQMEKSAPLPSSPQNQLENHKTEDGRLSMEEEIDKLEKILLADLKRQKHRQVIHPLLQDVGMKLSLLNPTLAIDLQYLGVQLPFPPSIHKSLSSSPDTAGPFVSRTGKTSDPTKIKGWREKFNTTPTVSEGLGNSSAFCSDMLDEYLEKEAQQINSRVAVFSSGSTLPVSYQLPSKSTSYVVTLDSRLKSQSGLSNKAGCNTVPNCAVLPTPPTKGPQQNAAPSSATHQGNKEKGGHFAQAVQAHPHAESTVGSPFTCSPPRLVIKRQSSKPYPKCNSNANHISSMCSPMVPAKTQSKLILHEMEQEAFHQGKTQTHITKKRAKFALTSLLNFQKIHKNQSYYMSNQDGASCGQDFCRLGCICDSLNREIRGPTHCRRVECMFDCNCFKHKVLLLHPPKAITVQQGKKSTLLAFPIAEPEREPRPPPAPSITTLWKRTAEELDPEPLFVSLPAGPPKIVPHPQDVPEEDKDPIYLYFESMMTCARVRPYKSNPPPQIHMVRINKKTGAKQVDPAGEALTSEETALKSDVCESIKLLEIISECNWEPHRNFVLGALFRHMNNNTLMENFCISTYKIRLLSTTFKRGDRCSTVTYKVCVSQAEEQDIQLSEKGRKSRNSKAKEPRTGKADVNSGKKSLLVNRQPRKLFSLVTDVTPAGYLKADKKKPGRSDHGLIKVNGKTIKQATLSLGQMGALHPVNRCAAFVIGRLQLRLQDQSFAEFSNLCPPKTLIDCNSVSKVGSVLEPTASWLVVSGPAISSDPKTKTNANGGGKPKLNSSSEHLMLAKQRTSQKGEASMDPAGLPQGATPLVPPGSKIVFVPGPPVKPTASPSAGTAASASLPTGQQVVLKSIPGIPGSNYLCQYNGQMLQLMPINPVLPAQPQPSSSSEGSTAHDTQTATATCLSTDTASVQKPLTSTPVSNPAPKTSPVTASRILSLSRTSGINIASGTPAFNVQSNFPGKAGTFTFRICPPASQGKPAGSEQGVKPNSVVGASSALVLPGGFTLIKLPIGFPPAAATVPTAVKSATSDPVENPQIAEGVNKPIPQNCSPSLAQNCQATESGTNTLAETSNPDSADLSHGNSSLSSVGMSEDKAGERTSQSANPVTSGKNDRSPKQGEMEHQSDDGDSLNGNIDCCSQNGLPGKGDSTTEESNQDLSEGLSNIPNNSAEVKASESQTMTVETVPGSLDETEALNNPSIHRNDLPPEADECLTSPQGSDKQNQHTDDSLPANHRKKIPFVNAAKQKSALDANTAVLGSQTSFSPVAAEKDQIAEKSVPNLIKIEPHNKPTEADMAAHQSDTSKAGLYPENSSATSSKTDTYVHTVSKNSDIEEQRLCSASNSAVSIKNESSGAPPKVDTSSDHSTDKKQVIGKSHISLTSKQEPNDKQTIAAPSSLPKQSVQHLDFKYPSQLVSSAELQNNLVEVPSLFSTHDTAPQNAEDSDEEIDVDGDVPCPLLEGQTPVVNPPPVKHLPNTTLKKTDPKRLCHQRSSSEGYKITCELRNQSYKSALLSKIPKCDKRGEDLRENRNKWVKSRLGKPWVDEMESDSSEEESSGSSSENSSSDVENSSDDTTTDSETTNDSADTSSEEDDDTDNDSIEDSRGKKFIGKHSSARRMNSKSADKFRERRSKVHRSEFTFINKSAPGLEYVKRRTHTEKERARRGEMQQSFAALKKALNVGDHVKMCKQGILNQAQLVIRTLEGHSQCLEERFRALLQIKTAYLTKITELSVAVDKSSETPNNHTESRSSHPVKTEKRNIKERCEQEKQPSMPRPQINPRRLDDEGNRLPPRLGLWKSLNYIRKRSKKSRQPDVTTTVAVDKSSDSLSNHTVSGSSPSVKTEDIVRTVLAHNPSSLPPITNNRSLSSESKPAALPKIVLQSFCKPDAEALLDNVKAALPASSTISKSEELSLPGTSDLQEHKEEMENSDSTRNSSGVEKTLPELSNEEISSPSPMVKESDVQNGTLPELEASKTASTGLEVRKRRSKRVVEKTVPSPDALGPRQLRTRSQVVHRMATRRTPTKKRNRII